MKYECAQCDVALLCSLKRNELVGFAWFQCENSAAAVMLSRLLFCFFSLPFIQAITEDELYFDKDLTIDLGASFPSGECYDTECSHEAIKRETIEIDTMKDYIKYLLRGNKTRDDHFNTEPFIYGNMTIGKLRNRVVGSIQQA